MSGAAARHALGEFELFANTLRINRIANMKVSVPIGTSYMSKHTLTAVSDGTFRRGNSSRPVGLHFFQQEYARRSSSIQQPDDSTSFSLQAEEAFFAGTGGRVLSCNHL